MARIHRLATLLAMLCLASFASRPAMAQSVLRDAETEALLADMAKPLFAAAGLNPANGKVVLIGDPSINAFVAGGQIVYVNSGLIDAADTANQVQGVVAHEIGHIVGGHAVFQRDGGYGNISILSLLLGAAAMAAGSAEAGTGILMAGQRAAIGKYLAYSRVQESSADAAGVRFLNTAGISGKGMLGFFEKLTQEMHRYGYYSTDPEVDPFAQTHPMSQDRVQTLKADLEGSPNWTKPLDPDLERRFKRVQAKLRGYTNDPKKTLRIYPLSDQSIPAHYARAYAYHQSGYPEQAAAETAALVKLAPNDPYFLELQGQILLESGQPQASLDPLRKATQLSNNSPLIASTFGHALVATEDKANLKEAEQVLRDSLTRDRDNPFAWINLGTVYDREGDEPRTALATAERANLIGDARTAMVSARRAMGGLPQGSPEWIRAQDIAMVSEQAMKDDKRNKGRNLQ
ncbi:peptidase M48 [Sphingomonas sp. ABOLD]|uniref:Putative Zn-dependent protease n=1 Tax=Sphingomonas trueperi TaxID=53317 RepID=A0A7X5XZR9_9SPHN|nr:MULTISPECIES: M48 family metalloprotease [Sphingomonas]NJB97978.1 putative Zn-dependent protease [Sphingomonas trueperi]RSV33547.1 peptidase M48 [Sphingomonas sp. ABOLE]RSV43085.1 peptidase M48 [Sphingomonas sp. ABOLD]